MSSEMKGDDDSRLDGEEIPIGMRRIARWVHDRARAGGAADQEDDPADEEAEIPSPAMLRERLWRVREDALYEMARYGIDSSRLAQAAGANAALEALGEAPSWWEATSRAARNDTKVEVAPACRTVVADAPGQPITLTLYGKAGAVAAVELDPIPAVALAGRLLDAAMRRLKGE